MLEPGNDNIWHIDALLYTHMRITRRMWKLREQYGEDSWIFIQKKKDLQVIEDIIDDLVQVPLLQLFNR